MLTPKWINHFYQKALLNAELSKLPIKVGAELVDPVRKVSTGSGFNGFPKGVHDTTKRVNDLITYYDLSLHAESNALDFSTEQVLTNYVLFCTRFPCTNCLGRVKQKGISTIYCPKPDLSTERYIKRNEISKILFMEGKQLTWVEMPE